MILFFQKSFIYSVTTLALGSRPKQRGCKVAGQEEGSPRVKAKALQCCGPRGSRGVTSHTPESVRKCEGATKVKGLQGCGPRGRKPENQSKGIARLRAKRKPGSHITYSRECKKV